MAPKGKAGSKGKGKGKKEVLPPPSTLPDLQRNYYIGGWSAYRNKEDISSISDELVAKHTREDREVDPLPRTNILFLPRTPSFSGAAESDSDDDDVDAAVRKAQMNPDVPSEITELVLGDKMQIEGISHLTVKRSNADKKEWIRPPKPEPEPEAETTMSSSTKAGGKAKGGKKTAAAAAAAAAELAAEEEAAAAAAAEEAAAAAAEANANENTDAAAAADEDHSPPPPTAEELAMKAYEEEVERLAQVEVEHGANFTARDAVMDGVIRLLGVLPQIVVKPILPTPPVREDPNAKTKGKGKGKGKNRRSSSAAGSVDGAEAKGGKKGSKGKKGKKAKLTPEELAEIERKMAEEDALFLQQTEEAIALAKEQEEHLMTFAHPDRWSNVIISNLTFTGPVQVVRAHTKFINCRFTSPFPDRPQLMVHQYCRVECVKCSFDAPARSALYGLPASQVTVKKCLFSGIPQLKLLELERPAQPEDGGAGNAAAADRDALREIEEDDLEDAVDAKKGGEGDGGPAGGGGHELPRTPAVEAAIEKVRVARPRAVGVFTDCSKVLVENCRFIALGTGVLFHGKYKVEKFVAAIRTLAKMQALAMLHACQFQYAFSTAICIDKTADNILVHRNVISNCTYYGLDLRQGSRDIAVYHNKFQHDAKVRIREGVRPQMLHNYLHSVPIDDNKKENPCMDVKY